MNGMMLVFQARIEAVITEREAMKAANKSAVFDGFKSLPYRDDAFQVLTSTLAQIEEDIKNYI